MSILHTVNKSPFEKNALDSCLGHAQPGDSILLIEDAVVAAAPGTSWEGRLKDKATSVKLHVLAPDYKARGFDPAALVEGITAVDYEGFVELAAANQAVNAWL
jgi:tRNA 2-thiouridine synthesizing protein B